MTTITNAQLQLLRRVVAAAPDTLALDGHGRALDVVLRLKTLGLVTEFSSAGLVRVRATAAGQLVAALPSRAELKRIREAIGNGENWLDEYAAQDRAYRDLAPVLTRMRRAIR